MRKVLIMVEVDDDKAIAEDLGTLDYLEREFGWLEQSGIFLKNSRILDDDDLYDAQAIKISNCILNEEGY
ncbi:MAG: hypothetical protein PUE12_18575 [Oscillospiraceae bacterium]|nr:hypothetical protein [Oscillospiraceae bacterium]